MGAKTPQVDKLVNFTARLPEDQIKRLKLAAVMVDTSVQAVVSMALAAWLHQVEADNPGLQGATLQRVKRFVGYRQAKRIRTRRWGAKKESK